MRRIHLTLCPIRPRQRLRSRRDIHLPQHPPEKLQTRLGLVKGHLVPGLVDAREAEVAVLAHLAVLGPADGEGHVARGREAGLVGVVERVGDGLAAEPVADVIGVAVVERHADGVVEDHFEILNEVGVGEVARDLEGVAHVVVRFRVVQVHAEGILDGGLIHIVDEVGWGSGIVVGMADIVDAATAELVVGFLDVRAALIGGLLAVELADRSRSIDLTTCCDLREATDIRHIGGEFHIVIDRLIDKLDSVGIVLGELRVVRRLCVQIEDSIADT